MMWAVGHNSWWALKVCLAVHGKVGQSSTLLIALCQTSDLSVDLRVAGVDNNIILDVAEEEVDDD